MTNSCLAAPVPAAVRCGMLTCISCEASSTGSAWHWIALLRPVPGGADVVAYCPSCAESKFRFFSTQRARRSQETEESYDFGD
jgi:hypothetical protein